MYMHCFQPCLVMHACMHAYIHVFLTFTHAHIHGHIQTYICKHVIAAQAWQEPVPENYGKNAYICTCIVFNHAWSCMHACMHACIHTYMFFLTFTHAHIHGHIQTYICKHVIAAQAWQEPVPENYGKNAYICTCIVFNHAWSCMHACMHAYMFFLTFTHAHIHGHIQTYICKHVIAAQAWQEPVPENYGKNAYICTCIVFNHAWSCMHACMHTYMFF